MWHIHRLINIETGEVRPFSPGLTHQVHEFRELIAAITRAQARRSLAGLRPKRGRRNGLEAGPEFDQGEIVVAEFFKKAMGE